jgi:hypothetical protein
MDEEESFDSYKARVDRIATLLDKAKDKPSNGQYMYRLIYELRPEFKPVILALATGDKLKDHDNIKWEAIVGFMNAYERDHRRLSGGDKESNYTSATVASAMGSNLSGDRGRQQGQDKSSNPKSFPFSCHFCNQKGHIKATCKKWLEHQLQLVQHRAHSTSTPMKSSVVPLVRCTNCGSTRHVTADHDESKVPTWRRKGAPTPTTNGQRADAATSQSSTSTTDSNRYSSLTMNEELSSEQGQNSPRMATCAIVCVGMSGSTTQPTSRRAAAKVTQKAVLSSKSATEPLKIKSTF